MREIDIYLYFIDDKSYIDLSDLIFHIFSIFHLTENVE